MPLNETHHSNELNHRTVYSTHIIMNNRATEYGTFSEYFIHKCYVYLIFELTLHFDEITAIKFHTNYF